MTPSMLNSLCYIFLIEGAGINNFCDWPLWGCWCPAAVWRCSCPGCPSPPWPSCWSPWSAPGSGCPSGAAGRRTQSCSRQPSASAPRSILQDWQESSLKLWHSISNRFCQCFSYIIYRVHYNSPSMHFRRAITDSGGPIKFRRANTDSGGPIRIQEGQYGVSRVNTEPSLDFRKANTEPSMDFRRAYTETYLK